MRDARIRPMTGGGSSRQRRGAAHACKRAHAHGHTLVELLLAASIGLSIISGIVSLYRMHRLAVARGQDTAQLQETGAAALTLIAQQVQMGGFWPLDASPDKAAAATPAVFGCSAGRPVGSDDALSCEALAGRSDGLAVRYIGDVVSTWTSTTGLPTDCLGQGVPTGSGDDANSGVRIVSRFFARVSSSTGEPELYCEGSGRPGSSQPLVEGVEKLRVRYWLAGRFDALDASALGAGQWEKVVAVDVCVQVRGAPVSKQARYVDCDGVAGVSSDDRARHAFWRRIAIRNAEEVAS